MTLIQFNQLNSQEKQSQLELCCGSNHWIKLMLQASPFHSEEDLLSRADSCWNVCREEDWKEAFLHHPKIGDLDSLRKKFASTANWASGEQAAVNEASESLLLQLKSGNDEYERKFGYIFIVCATGKSAKEMLGLLQQRLENDPQTEIFIAMQEQSKITRLRLKKLLS